MCFEHILLKRIVTKELDTSYNNVIRLLPTCDTANSVTYTSYSWYIHEYILHFQFFNIVMKRTFLLIIAIIFTYNSIYFYQLCFILHTARYLIHGANSQTLPKYLIIPEFKIAKVIH